jgi:hypothetical protein
MMKLPRSGFVQRAFMGISVESARSGHTPIFLLWVETRQAGLKLFQDHMDFNEQRPLGIAPSACFVGR